MVYHVFVGLFILLLSDGSSHAQSLEGLRMQDSGTPLVSLSYDPTSDILDLNALALGSQMTFSTDNIERMRIDDSGNVGIGVLEPVTRLDIAGGLKLGEELAVCDGGMAGALRYEVDTVEFCNGTDWVAIGSGVGGGAFPPLFHIQDQKPDGTHGGDFDSGAWRTRDLNTVLTDEITGASLSGNQITLPAGKYYIEASAPAYRVDRHQARLYNIDTDELLLLGTNARSRPPDGRATTSSYIFGSFTLTTASTIELQHRAESTVSERGFGVNTDFVTEYEVYSDIRIWKLNQAGGPGVNLAEGSVDTLELADNSVSTAKIQDGAVTNEKITSVDVAKVSGLGTMATEDVGLYVPSTRSIDTGTGLTGGGDLSANRTISFDESYGDGRYVNRTGDTITGNLTVDGNIESSGDLTGSRVFTGDVSGGRWCQADSNGRILCNQSEPSGGGLSCITRNGAVVAAFTGGTSQVLCAAGEERVRAWCSYQSGLFINMAAFPSTNSNGASCLEDGSGWSIQAFVRCCS